MTYGVDPVDVGFVASLARPGVNITGLTADVTADTWGKRLELVKEVAPRASHLAVLWNPDSPGATSDWKATEKAAATLGVRLQSVQIRRLEDFEHAFTGIASERPGALLVLADPLVYTRRREIVAAAAHYRIPAVHAFREATDDGGLMSYGSNIPALYRRAAYFVDRILKGTKPADLPVEQPSTFELVITVKTARALGLTISQSLLLRADQVIE
jgi:putative ABC transport system substrate-binding protein